MMVETNEEYRIRVRRFEQLRSEERLSCFNARARVAVEILQERGMEEYTMYVVNWSSVYKFHWQMFAFQKALMEELKNG
jgi:hypothetical protein